MGREVSAATILPGTWSNEADTDTNSESSSDEYRIIALAMRARQIGLLDGEQENIIVAAGTDPLASTEERKHHIESLEFRVGAEELAAAIHDIAVFNDGLS